MSLTEHVINLRQKHNYLEEEITDERKRPRPDQVRLYDLKRQKLRVKEQIEQSCAG